METTWDAIVIGHGLAGAVLATTLRSRGQRVLVCDSDAPITSSKIAAGIVSPITGQRHTLSWRLADFWPTALAFYETHASAHWHRLPQLRLLTTPAEARIWAGRSTDPTITPWLLPPSATALDPLLFHPTHAPIAMQSARLDVAAWLAEQRTAAIHAHSWMSATVTPEQIAADSAGPYLAIHGQHHRAPHIILCQGHAAAHTPHFPWLQWRSAKGEILDLTCPTLTESRIIHAGGWLLPLGQGRFRAGSTYTWQNLDHQPTPAGAETIQQRLRSLVRPPLLITGHTAAIRPIIRESKALIGTHPSRPWLGMFNGLGSKGVLLAPWYAATLADHLLAHSPLPPDIDIAKN